MTNPVNEVKSGDILTMRQTLERAKAEELPVSAYALRQWIATGAIPAQRINRKVFIYWPNVLNFFACADGVGSAKTVEPDTYGEIRKVKV